MVRETPNPLYAQDVVLAGSSIHNLLRLRGGEEKLDLLEREDIDTGRIVQGSWRADVQPQNVAFQGITTGYSNNPTTRAKQIRDGESHANGRMRLS